MESPFSNEKTVINVISNVTVILLFLSALLMLIWGTPTGMQRLGAFWIAVIALSVGAIKWFSGNLRKAAFGEGFFAAEFEEKVGKELKISKPTPNTKLGRLLARHDSKYTKEDVQSFLKDLDDHIDTNVVPTDLVLIFVATLLTGFGDLLFCLFRNAGHLACSS